MPAVACKPAKQAPEQAPPAVCAEIGLHALKAAHAVVQDSGRRVHCDALREGPDLRPAPAHAVLVLRYEQMVREGAAKFEVLHEQQCRAWQPGAAVAGI